MPITSEKVLRKMNEIQSKGGEPIGHWHQLRQWLKETEQVQENFLDAVMNDPDMSDAQKEYWLNTRSPTLRAAVQSEQNSASELLVTFDNNSDGGMDVDDLKKRLRGKHGWLTVRDYPNGQAQMFIAPNSNRSAGG